MRGKYAREKKKGGNAWLFIRGKNMNVECMSEEELKRAWNANLRMQDKWCRALEKLYVENLEPCAERKLAAEAIIEGFTRRMEEIECEIEKRRGFRLYLSEYKFMD